jgi:hypothetical protein
VPLAKQNATDSLRVDVVELVINGTKPSDVILFPLLRPKEVELRVVRSAAEKFY